MGAEGGGGVRTYSWGKGGKGSSEGGQARQEFVKVLCILIFMQDMQWCAQF